MKLVNGCSKLKLSVHIPRGNSKGIASLLDSLKIASVIILFLLILSASNVVVSQANSPVEFAHPGSSLERLQSGSSLGIAAFVQPNGAPSQNTTKPLPQNPNATSSHAPGGTSSVSIPRSSGSHSPPPPSGGGSVVQDGDAFTTSSSVSSLSVTLSSSITSGNIIVAMVNDEAGPISNTFTMGDINGRLGSWTTAVNINDGTITESGIYYATISSTGSDTIKVTFSTSTRYVVLSVWEIHGYTTSGVVVSSGSGDGSSFSVTSTSVASGSFALAGVCR